MLILISAIFATCQALTLVPHVVDLLLTGNTIPVKEGPLQEVLNRLPMILNMSSNFVVFFCVMKSFRQHVREALAKK